jgi:hypothetical protein
MRAYVLATKEFFSFVFFGGIHFWFRLKMGSQIKNEAVQFLGRGMRIPVF